MEVHSWTSGNGHEEGCLRTGEETQAPAVGSGIYVTDAPGSVIAFQVMQGSEPVAGMSVVRFGDRCEYHVGWFGEASRKLNAGNFLMWNIVSEMKARSCVEFDVGGLSDGNGYTRFKRTRNPREFALAGEWFSI